MSRQSHRLSAAAALVVSLALFQNSTEAATVTYKEGTTTPFAGGTYSGTQDAGLVTNGGNTTDNLGLRGNFEVGKLGTGDGRRHGLIRFDITSLAGQASSINSVTLRLYPDFINTTLTESVELYRLANANTGWVEGNGLSFSGFGSEDHGGSTWRFRVQGTSIGTGISWAGSFGASTPGVDYLTPLLDATSFSSSTPINTAFDFAFNDTSFISDWAAGTNSGLFLKINNDTTGGTRRLGFHSAESGTSAFTPELIIDFVPIPEPSAVCLVGLGLLGMGWRRRKRM